MAAAMTLTIRPATPADVESLLPLVNSAYRGDESRQGWTTEADLLTGMRIDEAGILAKISEPTGVVLLAYDASEKLTACCELLKKNSEAGYFGMFAVDPTRQGGGLGKQVLQLAEDYAYTVLGIKTLEMTVLWMRSELIDWYIRRGYQRTGEKKQFPAGMLQYALREDLYFDVLIKNLNATAVAVPST